MIVIPVAEPAIVHDQHFNAERGGGTSDLEQFFLIEFKVGLLPSC